MSGVEPGISVIVRTIGRASLREALASVDAQQREGVEVIVVDAAGSGLVPPPLRCPLRVLGSGRPLQRTRAAAVGLAGVRTRHAIFLDDDDLLLPGHLDKLAAALDASPAAVLAHTGVELVREGLPAPVLLDEPFDAWELVLGNRMPIHAALFDAQRARAAGVAFDESLDVYEDWDFWLQLRCVGPFVHVPGVSARYRVGADSSSVHAIEPGDEARWRIWRKWWGAAPPDWWARALHEGALAGSTRRELAATQQYGADLLQHLQEMRHSLQSANEAFAQVQQELAQAQQDAAQALAESAAREQAARASLAQTQEALAATRLQQRRVEDELHAMLQSTSWRLTRPLRRSATALRTLRAQLGARRRSASWRRWVTPRAERDAYDAWIGQVEAADHAARHDALAAVAGAGGPLLSVLMPVFDPALPLLDEAIESVRAQGWPHWELCIADDASSAPGVRERLRAWAGRDARIHVVERSTNGHISAATNSALALARGQWVVLLDQDDRLAPNALAEVADAALRHAQAQLIYSDEDKLDATGRRFEPHFKPAFDLELLRGQNFVNHLAAYRRDRVLELGGLREGFEGAQDHDLALRVVEGLAPSQVVHVPRVLYHWRATRHSTAADARAKPFAADAALRAVNEHLQRCAPGAVAEVMPDSTLLRVRYPLPAARPLVELHWLRGAAGRVERAPWPANASTLEEGVSSAPWVLMLREGVVPAAPGWLDELMALAALPGVGVAAGTVVRDGSIVAGGITIGPSGDAEVLWQGLRLGNGGPFGRARLAQRVCAASPACLLMRRELWDLWPACQQPHSPQPDSLQPDSLQPDSLQPDSLQQALAFGQRVAAAGWSIVWTPHAVVALPSGD